jgi:hypothetical protein
MRIERKEVIMETSETSNQSEDRDYRYIVVRGPRAKDVELLNSAEYANLEGDSPMVARVPTDVSDEMGVDLSMAMGMCFEQSASRAKQSGRKKK